MKLSMSKKLYLLMLPTLIVGIVICTIAWRSLQIGTAEIESANNLSEQALHAKIFVAEMADAIKSYKMDPSNQAEYDRKKKSDEGLFQAYDQMKKLAPDSDVASLIESAADYESKHLDPVENKLLDYIKAGKVAEANETYVKEYLPAKAESNKKSDDIFQKAHEHSAKKIAEVRGEMSRAANVILLSMIVGTLVLLACIVMVSVSLSKALRRITSGLIEAGNSVALSSDALSTAGQKVSSGTTEAASALEETVASVEELSSMVKLNSDNARTAADLSQVSTESAVAGEVEIQTLINSMSEIAKSSKKIEEIINVIDDIAFQTNLLALNAAVEAARAGEQGKGFAVVAEAVRNLAQRSATAAKDINVLIKDSASKTDQGVHVADKSSTVLKRIVESIKKVSSLNNEIAAASVEQSNGINQISRAMNELDRATQNNAAAASQVAGESSGVADQAQVLKALTDQLKLVVDGSKSKYVEPKASAGKILDFPSKAQRTKPKAEHDDFFDKKPKAKLGSVNEF